MYALIPSQLQSYTGGVARVELVAETVRQALAELDARYPGLRFRIVDEQDRIRPHVRIFADRAVATLESRVLTEMVIVGALSGG